MPDVAASRPPTFEKDLTGAGPTSLSRTNENIWDSEKGKFRTAATAAASAETPELAAGDEQHWREGYA